MRRQLLPAIVMTVMLTVMLGLVYPLVVTGISQLAFSHRANGSFVEANGQVVGSSLIGQPFVDKSGNPDPRYFQPRPSAAGTGYDAMSSGGSNLGPSNPTLIQNVASRSVAYRSFNGLPVAAAVPVDAVTSSASGLDPDVSVANARIQAARVALQRNLPADQVMALVDSHIDARPWGFLGEPTVNVLDLNLALDRLE